ncbi:DUF1707 SHOCT-like domain-containing protein [Nocardioides insulae]|uniref:DUF1707 SHOCT-like domain-containing protein n=1 Tax=Nocardioides insulae TaxID=394734 RepID=UPI0004082D37|nr:DUF1707 domain-containing protein [Nocardioides insulae]
MSDFWGGFRADPRISENARLRAADTDRAQVTAQLDEAYADGRLSAEEHGERVDRALAAVTLGELPPLVADLLPVGSPAALTRAAALPALRTQAEAAYRRERQEALGGFLLPSLVCLVIWSLTMAGGFFWPAFIILGTGAHLISTVIRREDIVEKKVSSLQRHQQRELRRERDRRKRTSDDPEGRDRDRERDERGDGGDDAPR